MREAGDGGRRRARKQERRGERKARRKTERERAAPLAVYNSLSMRALISVINSSPVFSVLRRERDAVFERKPTLPTASTGVIAAAETIADTDPR